MISRKRPEEGWWWWGAGVCLVVVLCVTQSLAAPLSHEGEELYWLYSTVHCMSLCIYAVFSTYDNCGYTIWYCNIWVQFNLMFMEPGKLIPYSIFIFHVMVGSDSYGNLSFPLRTQE